ncbi:MAG TPA: hypothetical protein VG965_01585 [Patescibacteria group bacterium]|nr:hypothetical protein [Patescibacteria group bacterium]
MFAQAAVAFLFGLFFVLLGIQGIKMKRIFLGYNSFDRGPRFHFEGATAFLLGCVYFLFGIGIILLVVLKYLGVLSY